MAQPRVLILRAPGTNCDQETARAFELVLSDLGERPDEVLFIDDRAENTRAARDLGMRTITFTSASDLDRELRLASVEIPIAGAGKQQGCSE